MKKRGDLGMVAATMQKSSSTWMQAREMKGKERLLQL
jgi:hypothetical protein